MVGKSRADGDSLPGPDPLSFGNWVEFTWFGALLLKVCSRGIGIRVTWDYVKNAESWALP